MDCQAPAAPTTKEDQRINQLRDEYTKISREIRELLKTPLTVANTEEVKGSIEDRKVRLAEIIERAKECVPEYLSSTISSDADRICLYRECY
jgi:hypothetical protein